LLHLPFHLAEGLRFFLAFAHRARAAFVASSFLSCGVRAAMRALTPLPFAALPPFLPIGARTSGWVFETKKHKPHSASNILKRYLHPILVGDGETPGVTGKKAGEHAFRRYRNGYLRRMSCPVGLLKYWMAHSRKTDMSDVYDKSPEDEAWRLEEAERLGIGFELPENVPSCTECTEKTKTATELIAV